MAELETRQEKAAIWSVIMRDVERFTMPDGSFDIGTVNSKRWETINDTLEDLAGMLVSEVHENHGELDSLTAATEAIWDNIRDHLIEWAVDIETRREERRKIAAAYVEPYLVETAQPA